MKVLILKPSSLGDVIQALPVLRLIKKHLPQSQIYWWIETGLAGLLEGDPDLQGIIRFDRNGWNSLQGLKKLWSDIQWMRDQRFDWVIDLQSLARSGTVAWLANGRFTVGLDDHREGARGLFDVAVPRAGYGQHAVDWYLATLRRLGVPQSNFTWMPTRESTARSIRAKWPVDQFRWVAIQPGARWLNKRWPAEHYSALVRELARQNPDYRFAILGSAQDKPLAAAITAGLPERCFDLTDALTLSEMVEWIRASAIMISNDTGPMHVAAALGIPLVAIFGPTDPRRTGPYGQLANVLRSNVACAPCMTHRCSREDRPLECLTAISPRRVANMAQSCIENAQVAPRRT